MKKIISIILILMLSAAVLASCKKNDAPDGMILASGEAASYSLYVPEDWEIGTQASYTTANAKGNVPNVSVTSFEFDDPTTTVDQWWETQKEELIAGFGGIEEISDGDTVVDGLNAREYVYSAKHGTREYVYHQVAVMKNGGEVYLITYTSTPETYEENLSTFNKITAEFRF